MKSDTRFLKLAAAVAVCLPLMAHAQTLNITNGVQTLAGLTNTTVTMSGRSELHITGTNNPISGCTINLASSDAWLFLPGIRPSSVSANYLSQILVNGAAAVAGGNCRLDEYVMGSVIVPQSPGYLPLQVFGGPNFVGPSAQLGLYTYYTNTALGTLNRNIGSFRLKHGYFATFAQNADGTGASQVFIAQDADLDVGQLAASLKHPVSFVRVFPWRWTGKKGWVGGLSSDSALLDPLWNYDYDNVTTSTLDVEYIPMRDTASWDAFANINSKQKSTQVLAFNEPDQANQANMTVASAIGEWPALMASGLRLGAPAVSSSGVSGQGLSWLYSFMSQATNLGYRVDYVPVHLYKCSWTTTQFSNYLAGVYQTTGKPVWVTEFNDTDFSSGCNQTASSEAADIGNYISMMESCPFVERYSIYPYFSASSNLAMTTTNTPPTLTPAGQIYHDLQSTMAYTQTLPAEGNRGIAQFQFETNTLDSSGYGNNGFAVGIPGYTAGHSGQAITLDGTNSYLQLPPTIAQSNAFSFAAWVYWNGGANWQRIFDFGDDTSHYLFFTPSSGSGTLRFAIKNGGAEQIIETTPLPVGQWEHVALTLTNGSAMIYTNGVLAASSSGITIVPSNFTPAKNYLGKSQFPADPLLSGSLDEVQVADYVFTPAQIASLLTNSPPQFTTNLLNRGTAAPFVAFSTNVTGTATDPDPGDSVTYSKASGPAWLTVNSAGVLGGTPGSADGGTNYFTLRATDNSGASAFAVISVVVPITYGNGTWTSDADGNWNDAFNWSGGIIANGGNGANYTADFSTITITSDRTVNLDQAHTIGTLKFGDTSATLKNWILASSANTLTLDTGSTVAPSIVVSQNTATISAPLAGVNGFAKTGIGTLILGGANSLSGSIIIDTGSTTVNEGSVRAANSAALLNVTNILINDNNNGSSTFQLDGSAGNIVVPARLSVNCRNTAVATIQNLAGTNVITGFIDLNVGGNMFNIESDSGLLVLHGTNRYVGTLTGGRFYIFSGAGNHLMNGQILNSTNGAPIGLTKSGTGTLTLAGTSTYTNTTAVNGGTLLVTGSISNTPVIVASSATLGGTGVIKGPVTVQPGATFAPGSSGVGMITINNTLSLAGTASIEIDGTGHTSDHVAGLTSITYGGTLAVTNISGTPNPGDTYSLFTATSRSGNFANITGSPGAGMAFTFNPTNGVLSVISTVATNPTNIIALATNGSLNLSWPADHIGWHLESNSVNLADTNFWFAVPGSDATNQVIMSIDPSQSNVFFRMAYP